MQKEDRGAVDPGSDALVGVTTVVVDASGPDLAVAPDETTTTATDADTGTVVTTVVVPPASVPGGAGPGAGPRVRYAFTVPAGTALDIETDRTVALVATGGPIVAGLATPSVADAAGQPVRASWEAAGETPEPGATALALDLRLPADAAYPVTVSIHLGASVVATTRWGENEGGESLAVTPTDWGRVAGAAGQAHGHADLVEAEPSAGTTVMAHQLRCHQIGARDKATWNLEPWRPELSFLEYVAARCNPA